MIEYGIYFGKKEFYEIIQNIGGEWNDSKERPIVSLIKISENDNIFWAIPLGRWDHRSDEAKKRIQKYLNYPENDIRSCFYHLGNTDVKSIFFISDIVPISSKYIEREYIGKYTDKIYVIKNKILIQSLEKKVKRILSWENSSPNYFRQHITSIKEYLLSELISET